MNAYSFFLSSLHAIKELVSGWLVMRFVPSLDTLLSLPLSAKVEQLILNREGDTFCTSFVLDVASDTRKMKRVEEERKGFPCQIYIATIIINYLLSFFLLIRIHKDTGQVVIVVTHYIETFFVLKNVIFPLWSWEPFFSLFILFFFFFLFYTKVSYCNGQDESYKVSTSLLK